jgi:hypothetical protein
MKLTYVILNWGLLSLGAIHCIFTFKKYDHIELDAIWFFSTGLALILCGLLNHITLNFTNSTITIITIFANLVQALLCFVLAYNFPKARTIFAFALVTLLLVSSIIFFIKNNKS